MEKEIIWSPRSIISFERILEYLDTNWTPKEIEKFITNVERTLSLIQSDSITFKSSGKKNFHEVLITKHNLLIYRIKRQQIELVLFHDTRQHPKKKKF